MTLYGLPMMKVNMPGDRITLPVETPIVNSTSPVPTNTGATPGLQSTAVVLAPTVEEEPVAATAETAAGPEVITAKKEEPEAGAAPAGAWLGGAGPVVPTLGVLVGVRVAISRGG